MEPTKTIEELQNFNFEIKKIFDDAQDFLPILGTDYIELYVGNAKQSAHYYKTAFGFQSEAYAGLETGLKNHRLLCSKTRQDSTRFNHLF